MIVESTSSIFCPMAPPWANFCPAVRNLFGKLPNLSPSKNNGLSLTIGLECHFHYGIAYWNWALIRQDELLGKRVLIGSWVLNQNITVG